MAPEPSLAGPIDVVMPTWNCAHTLEASLRAIRADDAFPVGRIICVDRESTDGTQDIAKRYGAEIAIDTVSYGSALQMSIRVASSPWVASIDSDIMIPRGWFAALAEHARAYAGDDLAAVQSMAVPGWMLKDRVRRDYARGFFGGEDRTRTLQPGERGYTGYTLIRRDIAMQAEVAHLEAYADEALSHQILRAGGVWLQVPVFVEHRFSWVESYTRSRWNAAGLVVKEGKVPKGTFLNALAAVKQAAVKSARVREPRFLAQAVLHEAGKMQGLLQPQRYRRKYG